MTLFHMPWHLSAPGPRDVLDYGFWGASLQTQTQTLSDYIDTRPDVDAVHMVIYDSRCG